VHYGGRVPVPAFEGVWKCDLENMNRHMVNMTTACVADKLGDLVACVTSH